MTERKESFDWQNTQSCIKMEDVKGRLLLCFIPFVRLQLLHKRRHFHLFSVNHVSWRSKTLHSCPPEAEKQVIQLDEEE